MATISGGVTGAAIAAMGGDDERIAKKVNNFLCQILPNLDKAAINKRGDKLSEAFCLLWHHRTQGVVNGRQSDDTLITCLYATVLIDLWLLGKIEIKIVKEETCFGVSLKATVKVIDATKTNSCLDAAGFNGILRAHSKGKSKKLKEWLIECVERFPADNCASVILDSFVEKGILEKEKKWFGLKTDYPTNDKRFLRFGELKAMTPSQILIHDQYMEIIPKSKTDVKREGNVAYIAGSKTEYCPVKVLLQYMKAANIDMSKPQMKLALEIRRITLKEQAPDAFMSALLSVLRFTDKLRDSYDIMLRRHYNKEEYDKAKPCLNKILRGSGYVDDL